MERIQGEFMSSGIFLPLNKATFSVKKKKIMSYLIASPSGPLQKSCNISLDK